MFEFHVENLVSRLNKKKVTGDELKLIHKLLSVKVPGHYFSPHFRRGLWDGYRRFFNLLTGTLYTGLLYYAIRKLSEANINVETDCSITDEREKIPHHNNPISLDGIELRDYQEVMINEAVKKERGIISAPPNAGKSEVAAGIIQVLGLPANFFTHRLTLLRQTKERFEKRLGIEIGIMGGGEEDIKEVNVLSVASVVRKLNEPHIKELLKNTPVIICDEVHHASSKTFEKCFKACPNAVYRYGLSATPLLRDEISNMIVRGLTGDEIVGITNKELIESGVSALPSVYLLNVREPKIPAHYTFDQAYDTGILRNDYRNRLIINSAKHFLAKDKSVFILVWRIEHGEILLDQLQKEGIEVEFISGQGTNTGQVQDVLKKFSKKELKCVISSTISDEGLDVPALDVLIMGIGFKAPLKTIQRVGRGLRKKTVGENVVTIVDFVDWHSKKYLYKHSIDRAREYVNMGIRIFEVMDNEWKVIEER